MYVGCINQSSQSEETDGERLFFFLSLPKLFFGLAQILFSAWSFCLVFFFASFQVETGAKKSELGLI